MTNDTIQKVRRWSRAVRQLERAKSEVYSAECEAANAANDLGKFLVPEDHDSSEFNIWLGDGILSARRNTAPGASMFDYIIKWRKAPSLKVATEMALT